MKIDETYLNAILDLEGFKKQHHCHIPQIDTQYFNLDLTEAEYKLIISLRQRFNHHLANFLMQLADENECLE